MKFLTKRRKFILFSSIVLALCITYITVFNVYAFSPKSQLDYGINILDISMKNSESITKLIDKAYRNIPVNFVDIDGNTRTYTNVYYIVDIHGMENEIDKIDKSILPKEYHILPSRYVGINEETIEKILEDVKGNTEPTNARVEYSEDMGKYIVIPETKGNVLAIDAKEKLIKSLEYFTDKIDLDKWSIYKKAGITQDSPTIKSEMNKYKLMNDFMLTYTFGEQKETITLKEVVAWQNDLETNVSQYVDNLKTKYDTVGKPRVYKDIELSRSNYGWSLDKDKMVADILEHINSYASEEKEMIFYQRAQSFDTDIDPMNCIEVSIEQQRLWMYVNGECIVDTPIVTGCENLGRSTRKGIFKLTYKTRNATLRGRDYASFVNYWMPFDGGIGLHDATWRDSFGGTIYKNDGSHGCVNMPKKAAKIVYENITNTMPIIVY